jgi:hypothetical protein
MSNAPELLAAAVEKVHVDLKLGFTTQADVKALHEACQAWLEDWRADVCSHVAAIKAAIEKRNEAPHAGES